MVSRFTVIPVPDLGRDLIGARRVIDQNFHAIRDLLNRAIMDGTIIATGSVTEDHLSTDAKTLVGDVTGTVGLSGSTTVTKIRGKTVDAPVAGNDAKLLAYNHANSDFDWVDCLRDVLTARGDLLIRGASAEDRLAIGAANRILKSDGTDPSWATITSLLDGAFGSTRGMILRRETSAWAAYALGASGKYLYSDGTDVIWSDPPAAATHNLLSATHGDTTAASVSRGDVITGQGATPKWARLAVGASGKYLYSDGTDVSWADPPASSAHNILSTTHSDATTASVVRGDLMYGNSTPKWDRLAKPSAARNHLSFNGSDVAWKSNPLAMIEKYRAPFMMSSWAYGSTTSNIGTIADLGTKADSADTTRASAKWTNSTTTAVGPYFNANWILSQHSVWFHFSAQLTDADDGCFWGGFGVGNAPNTADFGNHCAAFRWRNGTDTNFQCVTRDGATQNTQDSGLAKDANWHDFEIFTPDSGVTWYFYIDGVQRASSSTNVPGTTTAMRWFIQIAAISSTAREIRVSSACITVNPSNVLI